MKLTYDDIRSFAFCVEYTEERDGTVIFSRFTKQQRNALTYGFGKSFLTAGVRLEFETDSSKLKIETSVDDSNYEKRTFYSFDIFCNGLEIGHIKNFNKEPVYPYKKYFNKDKSKTIRLPHGLNRICIYFPWSVQGMIRGIYIDDGAVMQPVIKKKKIIMFGDSITQGYDAAYPSNSYASRLADLLDADVINKGIGGSVFIPKLAKERENFIPDIITVAYGTNDWNGSEFDDFKNRCNLFYGNLADNYPDTPIYAISPIWRFDAEEPRPIGSFGDVSTIIKETADKYDNITFIDGMNFIPKSRKYYRDSYLHPNDIGFNFYIKALSAFLS